jgi:flagellar biosynthesis/type III secretory pathway protein FliH
MTQRARVLAEERTAGARVVSPEKLLAPSARRILRERTEACAEAERLVDQGKADAEAMVARAREEARVEAAAAIAAAKQEADVQGAARWIAIRVAEERRFEREADRVVSVAIAMAERLLGAELALDPTRVASIAETALAEARGARRALVEAHPIDAETLRQHVRAARLGVASVDVRDDPALSRGDLRLHTDLGAIDARLGVRFERLGRAVRDALGEGPSAHTFLDELPEPPERPNHE